MIFQCRFFFRWVDKMLEKIVVFLFIDNIFFYADKEKKKCYLSWFDDVDPCKRIKLFWSLGMKLLFHVTILWSDARVTNGLKAFGRHKRKWYWFEGGPLYCWHLSSKPKICFFMFLVTREFEFGFETCSSELIETKFESICGLYLAQNKPNMHGLVRILMDLGSYTNFFFMFV